jgi:hypothetical protein
LITQEALAEHIKIKKMAKNIDPTFGDFPNPFASNAEKDSETYGLGYGKFIEQEWLYGDSNSKYIKRKNRFQYLEDLRKNEVDVSKFKDILNINQDKAWTAIDWSFVPIIPKFVDVITDGFDSDLFKVLATGVDEVSQRERSQYKKNLETDMLTQDFSQQFSQDTGIDFTPKGYVPETPEELDLHMQMGYKQAREIASELIVDKVFKLNYWKETFNHVMQDIVTFRVGAVKNEVDKDYGIVQKYINPKYLIYSYDNENSRDKRGSYYYGEVKIVKVEDVKKAAPGKFTQEELQAMANNYTGRLGNGDAFRETEYLNFNVEIIKFCFKTTHNETYKKKYKSNLIKKDDTWELHPNSKSKKVSGTYDVWYEGNYVVGSNHIYGYRLMEDMIRPSDDINKVLPPYTVYETNTPSMVERMEKFANEIQITVLKLQQLIATAKPQGNLINIDALQEIDLGTGGLLKPIEALDIYNQRGDLLYAGRGIDGERIDVPIQQLKNGIGSDLQQLMNYYNYNVQMLYDVTGLNRVRDGSAPTDRSGLGASRLALSMSNTATKHILNGALSILEREAQIVISRIQQMNIYGNEFDKSIKNALGRDNVQVLRDAYKLSEHKFDIDIEVAPTEEEKMELKDSLSMSVQSGAIDIPDKIDIEGTNNLKLANELLKIKIKKRRREDQQTKERQIALQGQSQAQAAQAQSQAAMQQKQVELQFDQQKQQFEAQMKAMLMSKEYELDALRDKQKFIYEKELKMMDNQVQYGKEKYKEDRKDKRTEIQATQQSEMIDQRTFDKPSKNFEAEGEMKRMFEQQVPPTNQI